MSLLRWYIVNRVTQTTRSVTSHDAGG
jgi:hypothetical protein